MNNHILIIDDEANIRDLLSRFLSGIGYRVTSASSVSEALRAARREPPDLMISDLQLEDGELREPPHFHVVCCCCLCAVTAR